MYQEQYFKLTNYYNMLRSIGFIKTFKYFLNTHLFDIIYGVNTHKRILKDNQDNTIKDSQHGVLYMSTWTCEIDKAFNYLNTHITLKDFTFIDIGSGKGKVLLRWRQLLKRNLSEQKVLGVEYDYNLIKISQDNHLTMFGYKGEHLLKSVSDCDFSNFKQPLICFLYNPFNEVLIKVFIEKIKDTPCIIIYNNPVHENIFYNYEFTQIYNHKGNHANLQTTILTKNLTLKL